MDKTANNRAILFSVSGFIFGVVASAFFFYQNTGKEDYFSIANEISASKITPDRAGTLSLDQAVATNDNPVSQPKENIKSEINEKDVKTYEDLVNDERIFYRQRFNYFDSIRGSERTDSNWEVEIVDALGLNNSALDFSKDIEYNEINCAETLCRIDFTYFTDTADTQGAITTMAMKLRNSAGAMSLYNDTENKKIVAYFARPSKPFPSFTPKLAGN